MRCAVPHRRSYEDMLLPLPLLAARRATRAFLPVGAAGVSSPGGVSSTAACVDAEPSYDGLYFSIDNVRDEVFGFVSQQPTFTEYTVNVTAGEHTLQWEYYKDTIISSGLDGAEIMAIEVKGLAPSDLECSPCPTGTHSSEGAPRCTACAANQFSDNSLSGTCIDCPDGTWSLPGSIGNSSCTAPEKRQQ